MTFPIRMNGYLQTAPCLESVCVACTITNCQFTTSLCCAKIAWDAGQVLGGLKTVQSSRAVNLTTVRLNQLACKPYELSFSRLLIGRALGQYLGRWSVTATVDDQQPALTIQNPRYYPRRFILCMPRFRSSPLLDMATCIDQRSQSILGGPWALQSCWIRHQAEYWCSRQPVMTMSSQLHQDVQGQDKAVQFPCSVTLVNDLCRDTRNILLIMKGYLGSDLALHGGADSMTSSLEEVTCDIGRWSRLTRVKRLWYASKVEIRTVWPWKMGKTWLSLISQSQWMYFNWHLLQIRRR